MTLRVLVFAEDVLGATLACDLCDRVVVERCPGWPADVWSDRALRETQRSWGGVEAAEPWTTWARAKHGFDPTLEPHRLTAKRRSDPHDAKRTCDALLPEGCLSERGLRCWLEPPLDELERRGARTGLPDYLHDVARLVLPLLGGPERRT